MPTSPADTFGSLPDTYREIHAMLAEALAGLGALVELAAARGTAAVSAGACFQSPAGGEVVTRGGAKIVGSAQVRVGGAFLQHGSVLLFPGQDVVASLTRGNAAAPHDAGLAQLAPGRAGWEDVAEAVARSARRRWRVPATPAEAPAAVLARAGQLRRRYADDAWTWRR